MFLWFHVGLLNDLHLASKPRPRSSSARRAMPLVNQERLMVTFQLTIPRSWYVCFSAYFVLFSNKPPSPISLFKGRKLITPPSPLSPSTLPIIIIHWWIWSTLSINHDCEEPIATVILCVDWSRMVYLPPGSLNLFLIFGRMTLDFLCLSFSTLRSSSLWRTDTIFFAKWNKPPPPPSNKTPSLLNLSLNAFERN